MRFKLLIKDSRIYDLLLAGVMLRRNFFIVFLFFGSILPVKAVDYADSLETRLILVDNDEKLLILDKLIPFYFRNKPLLAKKKAEKMLAYATQENNQGYKIRAQRYIGLSESRLTSTHEVALGDCEKAAANAKLNGFIEELVLTQLAFADIYHQMGNNTKSLEYQIEALHLSDSMDLNRLISIVLINQARSYIELDDFYKAEQCLKKSLKHAKIHDQQRIIAEINIMLGDLFEKSFNHELGLEHYQKAFELYSSLGNDIQIAISLFKIGDCYFSMDQRDVAFQNHLNALAIRNRIKDETGLAESYNKIGFLCLENGETQRAIDNLLLGQSNAELVNSDALMQQSFDYLYQAYFSHNDYKKALFYQNKFMNISELIYSENNERKIEENNNKNEIEKREQEIKSLRVISERKEKQLSTSKKFIFTLALLLVVVLVSVVFFVKSYLDKKKFNKKLQRINKKVVDQNKKLTELNSTKDKFFSIIGHDLKGPLNSLTSFSQLLINHTASLTEEEIRTIAKDLDKSLKNLYELLDNLLGWARSQTGRIKFKPENYKIADLVRENIRLLSKAALNKNVEVEMLVDEEVFVFVDVNSIRTVLRNLLSNAIKFTNEGGVISIFADEWKDKVEIGIHDTGVGMRKEDQQKIFNVSAKYSTLGTNKEKGTGLGLILCKEFVERNNGNISVESEVGIGTTFKFSVPKSTKYDQVKKIVQQHT